LPAAVAAVVGAAMWVIVAARPPRPRFVDPTAIVVLAASGIAFLAADGTWSSVLAYCFFAVVAAGTRLPGTAAVGLLVATAVGVAFVLRDNHPTSIALALLGLAGVLLLGMGRRESLRRTEQRELQLVNAARVQEEHARAAALAERTRIARDVHDVLAHSLSALAVQLQGARLMLLRDGAPADTLAQVERAQHLASEGLAEARRAVTALRTAPVDLAEGLRALVADTPDATLEVDGTPNGLSATAQETVLRTAQEALTNARRHAPGAPVSVRLTTRDGATELEVRDHAGAPPPASAGGYGLVGMAERAALAGADLSAGPVEDGWRVLLRLHPCG
jgi:signal transduction histidine kinase